MTEQNATLARLTKEIVKEHISEFIELSKQLKGDYWTLEHYLSELNRKWELSRVIFDDGNKLLAFIIVSDKGESLHVHRIVVAKECHGMGLGRKLMSLTKMDADKNQKEAITLKAEADNDQTIAFYKNRGFEITGEQGDLVLMKLNVAP